jgi:hypothetical protein
MKFSCRTMENLYYTEYQKRDGKNDDNEHERHDAVEQLKKSEYHWRGKIPVFVM